MPARVRQQDRALIEAIRSDPGANSDVWNWPSNP
jgi:hypothetical protein